MVAQDVAKEVRERGCDFLDAPVSGGVGGEWGARVQSAGAEQGTLTFMVGGSQDAFSRASPLLQDMGKNLVHCGEVGTGQAAKVCNNMLLGIEMIGVAEALNLGVRWVRAARADRAGWAWTPRC